MTGIAYLVTSLCMLSTCGVLAYPGYKAKIPNADLVKNPTTNELFPGVGHIADKGAGPRNCFGKAFKEAENSWTVICSLDSDGDGMKNGEELGDPMCKWTEGSDVQLRTTDITHPGICTPTNTARCQHFNDANSDCKEPAIVTTNVGATVPTTVATMTTTAHASTTLFNILFIAIAIIAAAML